MAKHDNMEEKSLPVYQRESFTYQIILLFTYKNNSQIQLKASPQGSGIHQSIF